MDADLARVANDHWRMAYQALVESVGGSWYSQDGIDWFVTPHLPAPFANGCLALEPAPDAGLRAAIEFVASRDVDFRVRIDAVRAAGLLDAPGEMGLKRDEWTMPAMVLTPVPAAPAPAQGVGAELVAESSYDDFVDVMAASGIPRPAAEAAFGRDLLSSPDVALFLARLDGRPAGTSLILRTEDVAGIYAVTTIEEARRRGVGAAVTWAAVDHARTQWRSDAVVLQATEMGLGVYRKMGFEAVTQYASFGPAHDATR